MPETPATNGKEFRQRGPISLSLFNYAMKYGLLKMFQDLSGGMEHLRGRLVDLGYAGVMA